MNFFVAALLPGSYARSLVRNEAKKLDDVLDGERASYDGALRESGQCFASEALQPVRTAATAPGNEPVSA